MLPVHLCIPKYFAYLFCSSKNLPLPNQGKEVRSLVPEYRFPHSYADFFGGKIDFFQFLKIHITLFSPKA